MTTWFRSLGAPAPSCSTPRPPVTSCGGLWAVVGVPEVSSLVLRTHIRTPQYWPNCLYYTPRGILSAVFGFVFFCEVPATPQFQCWEDAWTQTYF